MENNLSVKTAVERTKKALRLKPSLGKSTAISMTRLSEGLACEIEEGNWKLTADMPPSVGGHQKGPTPGVYGRAALGSCLAIGYAMKAAELDIPLRQLSVEVQADFDDGALFGTADSSVPPGYLEVRYTVTIESDVSREQLLELLDQGDARSPYLDIFSRAQKCVRKVNIISSKTPI